MPSRYPILHTDSYHSPEQTTPTSRVWLQFIAIPELRQSRSDSSSPRHPRLLRKMGPVPLPKLPTVGIAPARQTYIMPYTPQKEVRTCAAGVEAQLSADHRRIVDVPADVSARAYSTPPAVDTDLHTPIRGGRTTSQSHSTIVACPLACIH